MLTDTQLFLNNLKHNEEYDKINWLNSKICPEQIKKLFNESILFTRLYEIVNNDTNFPYVYILKNIRYSEMEYEVLNEIYKKMGDFQYKICKYLGLNYLENYELFLNNLNYTVINLLSINELYYIFNIKYNINIDSDIDDYRVAFRNLLNINIDINTLSIDDKKKLLSNETYMITTFINNLKNTNDEYIDNSLLNKLISEIDSIHHNDSISNIFEKDYEKLSFEMNKMKDYIFKIEFPDFFTEDRYEYFDTNYIDDNLDNDNLVNDNINNDDLDYEDIDYDDEYSEQEEY